MMSKTLEQMFKEGLSNEDVIREYEKLKEIEEQKKANKMRQKNCIDNTIKSFDAFLSTVDNIDDSTKKNYSKAMKLLLEDIANKRYFKYTISDFFTL